jgi:hypothetical protein
MVSAMEAAAAAMEVNQQQREEHHRRGEAADQATPAAPEAGCTLFHLAAEPQSFLLL